MKKTISILSILDCLKDDYILLKKWDDFPAYVPGSDVDILVMDKFDSSKRLQNFLSSVLNGEDQFLRVCEGSSHIHLDIMQEDMLLLRVDLIDNFDFFTQFSIQKALLINLFLTRQKKAYDDHQIYVPSNDFDLLLRYFEYLE